MQSSALDLFIEQKWPHLQGLTVIKAHDLGPRALQGIHNGSAFGVCTFRDPRDCVASELVFHARGLDITVQRVNYSLDCLRNGESTNNILYVRYEDMMANRLGEIHRIARHLGMNADPGIIAQIDAKTNISYSKRVCEKIRDRTITQVFDIDSHRVDLQTQLHENHIDNARIGRWKDELSAEQGRYLTELFAPWLLKWGYETQASMKQLLSKSTAYFETGAPAGAGGMNNGMLGSLPVSAHVP